MKSHTASLANALILIVFGLWAYLGSDTPSKTAFIPVGFGVAILVFYRGIKREDKLIAHMAVFMTLLILGGLMKPLMAAIGRNDSLAIMRVSVMLTSTLFALGCFIKSFVDVRRAREAKTAAGG